MRRARSILCSAAPADRFFTPPWSAIVVLVASASYGGALLHLSAAQPGQRWLTTTVALIAVAGVVSIAKSREEQRLDQVLAL